VYDVTVVATRLSTRLPAPVVLGGAAVLVAGMAFLIPQWWCNRRTAFLPGHLARTLLANTLTLASMLAGGLVLRLGMAGVVGHDIAKFIGWVFFVAAAAFFAMTLSIMWFNQPSGLVPPHLRDQPGRWRERRKR
jgi:hypothetical protein